MDLSKLQKTRFGRFVIFRQRIGICFAAAILFIYYAFIIAVGLFPEFLGKKLWQSPISLGIIIGVSIILISIILTGIYTLIANKIFDNELQQSLNELSEATIRNLTQTTTKE